MTDMLLGGWVFLVKDGAEVFPRYMTLAHHTLSMYKKNPQSSPQELEEPTFSGFVNKDTIVEETGRRVLPNGQVLHLFSFSSGSCTAARKVDLGCPAAEATHAWVSALEAAANLQSENTARGSDVPKGSLLPRSISRFIPIGGAPGQVHPTPGPGAGEDEDDAGDNIKWRIIRLINGLRIFEGHSVTDNGAAQPVSLLKAEGVVEAEPDRIFEVIMNLDEHSRAQWDPLTDDAEVIEVVDGFTDLIRATYSAPARGGKISHKVFQAKRAWRRNEDGSYVISLWPDAASAKSLASGDRHHHRAEPTGYTWDIVPLCGGARSVGASFSTNHGHSPYYARSLVRYVLELQKPAGGGHSSSLLKKVFHFFKSPLAEMRSSPGERERADPAGASPSTLSSSHSLSLREPGALEELGDGAVVASISRMAGLREYFAALPPPPDPDPFSMLRGGEAFPDVSTFSQILSSSTRKVAAGGDEFFDALELSVTSEVDQQKKALARRRWHRIKWLLKFGLLIQSLSDSATEATGLNWSIPRELLHNCPPVDLVALGPKLAALGNAPACLTPEAVHSTHNGWRDPGGANFSVRGPHYLSDRVKVAAGEPLLKCIAMDWFTHAERMDNIAGRPGCLTQSEVGKSLPFIFVVNLQVPGPPHYSCVAYFASDRPIRAHPRSLLHRFYTSTDESRSARFKLIPRISEGHWMVKRAVGTKACILGKALKCSYVKGRNYLEMDCDIGSSSVARNVIGLVISYITTLVVDLAFLIEAQEPEDLPEYLLGAFTCIRLDTTKAAPPPPEAQAEPPAEGGT